jgi:hypothetical protein
MKSDPGSEPLAKAKHEAFAQLVAVDKLPLAEAYRKVVNPRSPSKSCHEHASKLANGLSVALRILWLRFACEKKEWERYDQLTLSIMEKRKFLARIVRTPAGAVTKDSDLCQEWSESSTDAGSCMKIKMPDKLKAIQIDNDLAGEGDNAKLGTAVEALAKLMGSRGPVRRTS